jgi:hypothetical protein
VDRSAKLQALRDAVSAQLEAGETLQGLCYANDQKVFSGTPYLVGVTDRRLLMQKMSRRGDADGPAASILPTDIAEVSAGGGGGGWATVAGAIGDATSVVLKLRTHDGRKHKLMMMRGEGLLGALAGEGHAEGMEALSAWFATHAPS